VSLAKKPSTALSQDADVGVKWRVQRGWRASHWSTCGCLWVEGLDLALLIDGDDDGMIRRIDIEADNVPELGGEGRVIGQFELAHLVGLEAMGAPDALDRTDADPDRLGHGRCSPVRRFSRRGTARQVDHLRDHRPIEGRKPTAALFSPDM
jgi:hypothetical protein